MKLSQDYLHTQPCLWGWRSAARGEHCPPSFSLSQGKILSSDSFLCIYESEGNPDASYTYRNPLIPMNNCHLSEHSKGKVFLHIIQKPMQKNAVISSSWRFSWSYFCLSPQMTEDLVGEKLKQNHVSGKVKLQASFFHVSRKTRKEKEQKPKRRNG